VSLTCCVAFVEKFGDVGNYAFLFSEVPVAEQAGINPGGVNGFQAGHDERFAFADSDSVSFVQDAREQQRTVFF